jgi:uncharacterized protein (DUF58 family)
VFLVSDFRGALEERALEQLYQLGRHLEITALHCSDPLEQALPEAGRYTVTDGSARAQLFTGDRQVRDSFAEGFDSQLAALRQSLGKLGIPLIAASTADSPLGILQAYYAGGARR